MRLLTAAASVSRFSTASRRRAVFEERSAGRTTASISAASRSAEVRRTLRFRPPTPKRASSAADLMISRSLSV